VVAHCVELLYRHSAGHAQLENVVFLRFEAEFIGSVFLEGQGLGLEDGRGVLGQIGVDLGR
jgi:hypothetical protein